MRKMLILPLLAALTLGGCADMTDTQRSVAVGTGLGAATGAAMGSLSGNMGWGALIGAGAGAAGGYLIGRQR